MSATPVRQRGYPIGIALYGAEFVLGLVLITISINLVVMAMTREAPPGILVSSIGLVVMTGGITLFAGAGVFYQARPVLRPPARESVAWHAPLVVRAAIVITLIAVTTIGLAFTTVGPTPMEFLLLGTAVFITWSGGARALAMRLEADQWGIRCTNPLTTVRIPWNDVESLEPRGESVLAQRIVAITKGGRERILWVFDPRIPASREAARILVAELEAVWRSAAMPRPDRFD